jgi:hypothetical protein
MIGALTFAHPDESHLPFLERMCMFVLHFVDGIIVTEYLPFGPVGPQDETRHPFWTRICMFVLYLVDGIIVTEYLLVGLVGHTTKRKDEEDASGP